MYWILGKNVFIKMDLTCYKYFFFNLNSTVLITTYTKKKKLKKGKIDTLQQSQLLKESIKRTQIVRVDGLNI